MLDSQEKSLRPDILPSLQTLLLPLLFYFRTKVKYYPDFSEVQCFGQLLFLQAYDALPHQNSFSPFRLTDEPEALLSKFHQYVCPVSFHPVCLFAQLLPVLSLLFRNFLAFQDYFRILRPLYGRCLPPSQIPQFHEIRMYLLIISAINLGFHCCLKSRCIYFTQSSFIYY